MKNISILGIVIFITTIFAGCGGNNKFITFNDDDVEYIEVFTGSVPAQAVKKTVTDNNDIKMIIRGINALNTERKAVGADTVSGGIGTIFYFHLSNGDSILINNQANLVATENGFYKVKGKSLDTDAFWLSLNYEEIKVGQWGLPNISDKPFGFGWWWDEQEVIITHILSGTESVYIIDDKKLIDDLNEWFIQLSVQFVRFAEGESPGDTDGGEVFVFSLTKSDSSFSYGKYGIDENYIFKDNEWFYVENPSDPFTVNELKELF